MLLERLQHMLRIDARIFVVESGDKPERDHLAIDAIDPGSAVFIARKWVPQRVNDLALLDAPFRKLPQFLHPDAVRLRIALRIEIEAPGKLLRTRSARPFSEDRHLRTQIVSWLEIRFRLVLLIHSLVVRAHADDLAVFDQDSEPAKPLKIVIPACSTFDPIHFTNLLIEMT